MMPITHDVISTDEDLGRRVLTRARTIAPCLDALDPESEAGKNAIAILKGVAAAAAEMENRALASKAVGPMRETYRDIDSHFSADDKASLRSLCAAQAAAQNAGALPVGSFPSERPLGRLWPETYSS